MPRLTRTQKFADLREQLSNDKEESFNTQDLSKYQNRFNNVQDTLNPTPVVTEEENKPEYVWTPFKDDSFSQPVNEVPAFEQPVQQAEPVIEKPINEVPVFEQPVQQAAPAFEEVPVEETKIENSYFDSFMSEPVKEESHTTDFSSYFEEISQDTLNQPIDQNNEDVFNDVSDDSGEIVSQKERDTYLNQTISDVNMYNISNGEQTINTTVDSIIDEIRHPENNLAEEAESIEVVEEAKYEAPAEEVKYEAPVEEVKQEEPIDNTYAWTPFTEAELDADKEIEEIQDDEEFSNTVSMEITKIMDEIAAQPQEEVKFEEVKAEEVIPENVEEPVVEETIQINEAISEEKPEEVVEIKNISEIEAEPVKDTMSSTIPFVVAAEEEEAIEEDEEEDGSNTVLNVILIVLIVVLIAVLGLIVFYILKTKGIF